MQASIANSIDAGSFTILFFRKTATLEPLTPPDVILSGSVAGTSTGYKLRYKMSTSYIAVIFNTLNKIGSTIG